MSQATRMKMAQTPTETPIAMPRTTSWVRWWDTELEDVELGTLLGLDERVMYLVADARSKPKGSDEGARVLPIAVR